MQAYATAFAHSSGTGDNLSEPRPSFVRARIPPACLYVSNHRDIVLDTALLNEALMAHDKPIPHVAIGDNLLETEWVGSFFRLCRALVVRRDLSGKQLYQQCRRVSELVRVTIGRGESVWTAQRPATPRTESTGRSLPSGNSPVYRPDDHAPECFRRLCPRVLNIRLDWLSDHLNHPNQLLDRAAGPQYVGHRAGGWTSVQP